MRLRSLKALALLLLVSVAPAQALCNHLSFMDPVNDIAWDCIFPISIMGVPLDFGEHPPDQPDSQMICSCPGKGIVGEGFMVGFWEPARMVETVSDPWCFPGIGMDLGSTSGTGWGYSGGGRLSRGVARTSFQHFHYYIMPVWAMLNLFTDIPCLSSEKSFDLAMVSEVRPDWHDDLMAAQLYPETALMANAASIFACIADAVASVAERPIDALYWCMGTWGTTYPMSGHMEVGDYVVANAATAGKAMYVQARTGMLVDRAVNYCEATPMPIWVKSHWRLQEIDPSVDRRCHAIGDPGITWTQNKNIPGKTDNFSWILFRKVSCCVVVF